MTADAADIIGIIGSALFIVAFAYANAVPTINKLLFNAVNLTGAILLIYSLSVHFNLASMVLEIAWGIIALWGLIAALRRRGDEQ
jgi:hypothetical protein